MELFATIAPKTAENFRALYVLVLRVFDFLFFDFGFRLLYVLLRLLSQCHLYRIFRSTTNRTMCAAFAFFPSFYLSIPWFLLSLLFIMLFLRHDTKQNNIYTLWLCVLWYHIGVPEKRVLVKEERTYITKDLPFIVSFRILCVRYVMMYS